MVDFSKPFVACTLGEVLEGYLLMVEGKHRENTELVRGIRGIANALGVGLTKAQQLKNSGVLDDAIRQDGKLVIADVEKLKHCFLLSKQKKS